MTTYKIQYGDTLTSIAKKYNTTVDVIANLNGIKNKNLIYAGDTLKVPTTETLNSEGNLVGSNSLPINPQKVTTSTSNKNTGTSDKNTNTADKNTSAADKNGKDSVTAQNSAAVQTVNPAIKNSYKVDTSKIKKGANTLAPTGSKNVNSNTVSQKIKNWEQSRPEDTSGRYDTKIKNLFSALLGMDFDYDPADDIVYKMISDTNRRNARLAMEDTLGKLSPKSGGYANSYAQAVSQQAYAGELSKTVDMIPELYEAAYERFDSDRDALSDGIELLTDYSDSEFDKYNDLMKLYLSEGEMLFDNFNTLSKEEYDRFLDYAELLENEAKINNQRFK